MIEKERRMGLETLVLLCQKLNQIFTALLLFPYVFLLSFYFVIAKLKQPV